MTNCKHCQQGIHLQNGIHMGEVEMHKCERELTLVPKERDTWYPPSRRQPDKEPPFTFGGEHGKR